MERYLNVLQGTIVEIIEAIIEAIAPAPAMLAAVNHLSLRSSERNSAISAFVAS